MRSFKTLNLCQLLTAIKENEGGVVLQFMYPKWELEQVYKLLVGPPERGEPLEGPK